MKPSFKTPISSSQPTQMCYVGCKFRYGYRIYTCVKQYNGEKGSIVIEFEDGQQVWMSDNVELITSEF